MSRTIPHKITVAAGRALYAVRRERTERAGQPSRAYEALPLARRRELQAEALAAIRCYLAHTSTGTAAHADVSQR